MTRTDAFAFPTTWGGQLIGRNEARFRIWAPGVERLELDLGGKRAPMERDAEGWFELVADGVSEGAAYGFILPDGMAVPDPAARAQVGDVHGPSKLVDPASWSWRNAGWRGRPWEEAVIYELHIGAFTPQGNFAAAARKLPYLAELGVTAVELMPVAQFSGNRGWGYDGVLLYAPHNAYGSSDELKAFVDAAHGHGLMMLLDVVYNHFGPDGNYLPTYASDFFHPERHTPWGAAIAYEKPPVRQFFIENALYWLEEYRFDGLRLDAVDNVKDEQSDPEILIELAERVRSHIPERLVHLTTEDNRNVTHLHERGAGGEVVRYTAEWNDDFHNVVHVIATGEEGGYEIDFGERRWWKMARALAEGFAFQGESSPFHDREPRGEPSAHLPPTAFIDFIQNHDQIGNRAFGDRMATFADARMVKALTAILLLSPHIPLIFMGEETGETRPFRFFTDFHGELADAVREGRRKEFARSPSFGQGDPSPIPDPNAPETFEASKLDWHRHETGEGRARLDLVTHLLALRRKHIVPLLAGTAGHAGTILAAEDGAVAVDWRLSGATLSLRFNLSEEGRRLPPATGEAVYAHPADAANAMRAGDLPAFSVFVTRNPDDRA